MKKILTLILTLVAFNLFAQLRINDSTDTESFKILTGSTFRGTYPKGSAFIDVDASSRLGIKLLSGAQIASYNTFGNFIINGVTPSSFAQAHQLLSDILGIVCCDSGGGGGGCLESCTLTENVLINSDGNSITFDGTNHSLNFNTTQSLGFADIDFDGFVSVSNDSSLSSFSGNFVSP